MADQDAPAPVIANETVVELQGFEPPLASTPRNSKTGGDVSFAPAFTSTPKKNIRFMDESISKIHVFPTLPASPGYVKKHIRNYATTLPTILDEPQPYNPILYTFRVPDKWPKMLSYMRVRTPPFYLQLDHTIAVIWCMFCPSAKKSLGIAQLQWALSFLNSIFNRNSERPKDIQVCIEALQDYLVELYADISNKLEPLKNMEKSQREEEEAPVETEIPFSINYSEIIPRFGLLTESMLSGGHLVNIDDVYRREVEDLKEVVGTESVDLMTSKSREAAIDYLNETRDKHLKNMVREAERVKSLENLLSIIGTDNDVSRTNASSLLYSILGGHDESSDINDTHDMSTSK